MQKINSFTGDIFDLHLNEEGSIHSLESESEPECFNLLKGIVFPLNEKEIDNISCELADFGQINEDLISSQIINNKSYEKSEEKEDNLVISLSSINDNESNMRLNYNNELNNTNDKIFFINKKSKFSEKKKSKVHSIFTPRENNDILIKLINEDKSDVIDKKVSIANSDDVFKTSKKYKFENIVKKMKTCFLKQIKIKANLNLKSKGCKKQFTYFQPSFVNRTSKNMNKIMFKKTLKDVLLTDITESMKDIKTKNTDKTNYKKNISVLEHLKRNKYYFYFLDITIMELYIEYLNSKEFEMDIINLKNNKKEDIKYIKYFLNQVKNTINYFS